MNYLITSVLITFLLCLPKIMEKLIPTTIQPTPPWLVYFLGENGGRIPYPEWPNLVNQKVGDELLSPHQLRKEGFKLMQEYYRQNKLK